MYPHNDERRRYQRFNVETPVIILGSRAALGGGQGLSRDISEGGLFFYTDCSLPRGLKFQFRLVMPPEVTHGENRRALCSGRVARIEEYPDRAEVGIAATIESLSWS